MTEADATRAAMHGRAGGRRGPRSASPARGERAGAGMPASAFPTPRTGRRPQRPGLAPPCKGGHARSPVRGRAGTQSLARPQTAPPGGGGLTPSQRRPQKDQALGHRPGLQRAGPGGIVHALPRGDRSATGGRDGRVTTARPPRGFPAWSQGTASWQEKQTRSLH